MALRGSVSLPYGGGLIACGLTLLVLSACASKIDPQTEENYATPLGSAMVTPNPTPYTPVLFCLAAYAERNKLKAPRIAVGRILDLTGKLDENGGRTVTQGAMLMAISALGKAVCPWWSGSKQTSRVLSTIWRTTSSSLQATVASTSATTNPCTPARCLVRTSTSRAG
jgi:hypothetical protein